jgi:hypothetical protein
MYKIHFITFGGPNNNFHEAVQRICAQAESFDIFESICGYTEQDLISDTEFWNTHGNFITNNPRGYGYWIWKPYLILKKLKQLEDNELLLYLDCGCELNIGGKEKFFKMINIAIQKLIIGTSTVSNDLAWTKRNLIEFMGMVSHPKLKEKHMQAGAVLMVKCDIIVQLYEEFYQIMHNYHLIDDSSSTIPNLQGFREHRHDQSVFNLLVKKYDLINYSMDPTEWGFTYRDRNKYIKNAMSYPIWYCRNVFGKSLIS